MNVAVVALERLRQSSDAGDVVPAHVAQQFHPLASQDAREGVPAFKRQMAFMKNLSALSSVPGINDPARRIVRHRSADSDFHVAHLPPRNICTSDQKSAVSCSTVLNA